MADSVAALFANAVDERLEGRFDNLEAKLDGIVAATTAPLPPRRLTRAELAQVWGVSVRQVDALRAAGMPTVMVGSSPRFDVGSCEAWLAQRGGQP